MQISLEHILTAHDQAKFSAGEPGILGDSFLLKANRIYRNARSFAAKMGFRLIPIEEFPLYFLNPIVCLDELWLKQVLPFLPNADILRILQKKSSGTPLPWNHPALDVRRNHVFHEACHVLFRDRVQRPRKSQDSIRVFDILCEESFVNTCEVFLLQDVDDPIHHEMVIVNSHLSRTMAVSPSILQNFLKRHDSGQLFTFIFLTYLCSNYLHLKFSARDLKRLQKIAFGNVVLTKEDQRILTSIAKDSLRLSPQFRVYTSDLYFRLQKIRNSPSLYEFDFLNEVESGRLELRPLIQQVLRGL